MKTNPLALLAVVALTVVWPRPALANPYWGEFKKDNCSAIGKRQYSAILWNISGSWEAACKKMPATINGKRFASPARCKNMSSSMWGEFDLDDSSCTPRWGEFSKGSCKGPGLREYSAILWDIKDRSWEDACNQMPATINGQSFARPTRCFKRALPGIPLNMWGQFDVPDKSCK
ncbi:hypothetical protein F0U60_06220 [Archangium minus]|uniref:Uncharacterized protein n=1 Tax=Archangium minus TaxID=83450 RepID=A0ABY9WIX9_9BACT|nr:hypothetical protein F0U60_06220 [Archangium minus]